MSDIIRELKRVEHSLSNMSSDVGYIATDYPDAKSKLYSLENEIGRLLSDVRTIRKKIESGEMN
jgi:predicted  nucleic acid-binding Zn-ribbon protein